MALLVSGSYAAQLAAEVPTGSWNETYAWLTLPSSSFDGSLLTVGELYEYAAELQLGGKYVACWVRGCRPELMPDACFLGLFVFSM